MLDFFKSLFRRFLLLFRPVSLLPKPSYWVTSSFWECPNHVPVAKHPDVQGACGIRGCKVERPGTFKDGPKAPDPKEVTQRPLMTQVNTHKNKPSVSMPKSTSENVARDLKPGTSPTEAQIRRGATHPTPCLHCGTVLYRRKKDVDLGQRVFCDAKHRADYEAKNPK